MNDPYEWHNTICRGHFLRKNGYKKAKENMADLSMNKALAGEYIDIL